MIPQYPTSTVQDTGCTKDIEILFLALAISAPQKFTSMVLLMQEIWLNTRDLSNLVNNGINWINYISTGAGFLPSTVVRSYLSEILPW